MLFGWHVSAYTDCRSFETPFPQSNTLRILNSFRQAIENNTRVDACGRVRRSRRLFPLPRAASIRAKEECLSARKRFDLSAQSGGMERALRTSLYRLPDDQHNARRREVCSWTEEGHPVASGPAREEDSARKQRALSRRAALEIRRDRDLLTSKRLSTFIADSCAHSRPSYSAQYITLVYPRHRLAVLFPAAVRDVALSKVDRTSSRNI